MLPSFIKRRFLYRSRFSFSLCLILNSRLLYFCFVFCLFESRNAQGLFLALYPSFLGGPSGVPRIDLNTCKANVLTAVLLLWPSNPFFEILLVKLKHEMQFNAILIFKQLLVVPDQIYKQLKVRNIINCISRGNRIILGLL